MAYEELIERYEAGGGRLAKARAEGLAVPPALKTALLTCMDFADQHVHAVRAEAR
jgi:carbonic anhydrase